MQTTSKNILLALLLAAYVAASNGVVLQYSAGWISGGGESAVVAFKGPVKELPKLSLSQRAHLPLVQPVTLLSLALPAQAVLYPAQRPYAVVRFTDPPATYEALFFSDFCNKAPPAGDPLSMFV